MGMHLLQYDIGIVGKVGKNAFVATEQVNYLEYAETNSPKYRVFCVLTRRKLLYSNTRQLNCHFNYKLLLSCLCHYKNAVLRRGAQYVSELFVMLND
jgi:hypothetical protein